MYCMVFSLFHFIGLGIIFKTLHNLFTICNAKGNVTIFTENTLPFEFDIVYIKNHENVRSVNITKWRTGDGISHMLSLHVSME